MRFSFLASIAALAGLVLLLTVPGPGTAADDYSKGITSVAMRKIGDKILLLSGDSSSRVLPVKQSGEQEFQLQFESPFSFLPDSLVAIVKKTMQDYHQPREYTTTVTDCSSQKVVYSFAAFNTAQDDVPPCLGREQPLNCYLVNISFPTTTPGKWQPYRVPATLLLLVAALVFAGIHFYKKKKAVPAQATNAADAKEIGRFSFSFQDQQLLLGTEKISLTAKEAAIFNLLASDPNEVISRARLQKEIWEDEGVIVGRSLDVFISKLRKKLEKDPSITILNVHGKGYKLAVAPHASS